MRARIIRLFPNRPNLRFEWPVHEQVATSLMRLAIPVQDCEAIILHDGYADPVRNQQKQRRNIAILKAQIDAGSSAGAMTWFLVGGAHLDLGEVQSALDAYGLALRHSLPGEDIHKGALVRTAECLRRLGRLTEVLELASESTLLSHPDFCLSCLQAALGLGQTDSVGIWLGRILDSGPGPHFPPANPAVAAAQSFQALGELWRSLGRPDLGVAALRLALKAAAGKLPTGFRPSLSLLPPAHS